jgi:hypothetical protein
MHGPKTKIPLCVSCPIVRNDNGTIVGEVTRVSTSRDTQRVARQASLHLGHIVVHVIGVLLPNRCEQGTAETDRGSQFPSGRLLANQIAIALIAWLLYDAVDPLFLATTGFSRGQTPVFVSRFAEQTIRSVNYLSACQSPLIVQIEIGLLSLFVEL